MSWLDPDELRVGLGCMRLPADEELAHATIAAALESAITVFDTAHAYGPPEGPLGANERLLAVALRGRAARIVTKGGMTRAGGGWIPDGRAKAIRAGCEASLEALGGLPVDLFLLHAPDPRTPWKTSIRALARLAEERLVRRVGVANVNYRQLDEALALAPIAAVQVALSVFDDRALRGGTVERCEEAGVAVIAHSPLGGPKRTGRVGRNEALRAAAEIRGADPAELALAWVLGVSPVVVAIPGARRPDTARSAARAATLALAPAEHALVGSAFGRTRSRRAPRGSVEGEVVLVIGIPGAGKSRLAGTYTGRGYARLNRDERGGSLARLAEALDELLGTGTTRVVLDNTYLTRVSRSHPIDVARRHGLDVRCVWLDTPVADAQVNLVERLLDRFGALPSPEELQAAGRREPGLLAPTSFFRAVRELEPPSPDEGFVAVERVPFERVPSRPVAGAVFVAAAAVGPELPGDPAAPHLVFDWNPDGDATALEAAVARLETLVAGPVEGALCPHGGGPPRCWCRPPLPGLPLAFTRRHGLDPTRSTVIGCSPAHRTLAAALGARYISPR